jgi:hypothetical protein
MGLDASHDCWHGPYSAFNDWRTALCAVAGYGDLRSREGFGGVLSWPEDDVLVALLKHSDCDGDLSWKICNKLADRLEELLPAMQRKDVHGFPFYGNSTQEFIDGLHEAHAKRENVEFR